VKRMTCQILLSPTMKSTQLVHWKKTFCSVGDYFWKKLQQLPAEYAMESVTSTAHSNTRKKTKSPVTIVLESSNIIGLS
jgi:hypothetical protein